MTTIINRLRKCIDVQITSILGMMVLVFSNVLLGAAVLRRDEHLTVTAFLERFFPSAVPILNRVIWLIMLIFSGILLLGAVQANWHNLSPLTGLPVALFALAGGFLRC